MKLRKCPSCGRYTLKQECSTCSVQTRTPRPPKYSPQDKYGKYRRLAKKNDE